MSIVSLHAGVRAPLLQIRTDRSPATSRPSTPGSHDGGRAAATSPFSALHRDPGAAANPAAIRLSFAVHRDGELTDPHPSHPAVAASQPLPSVQSLGLHNHPNALPSPPGPQDGRPAAGQRSWRRMPSLTLQRFASEPPPEDLPPQRRSGPGGRLTPSGVHRPGRHSAGSAAESRSGSGHTRSHSAHSTHSTHGSPLQGVADFRAMLVRDVSVGQNGNQGSESPVRAPSGHAPSVPSPPLREPTESPAPPPLAATQSLPALEDSSTAQGRHLSAVASAADALADSARLSVAFPSPQSSGPMPVDAAPPAATNGDARMCAGQPNSAEGADSAAGDAADAPLPPPVDTSKQHRSVPSTAGGAAATENGRMGLAEVAPGALAAHATASQPCNAIEVARPAGSGGPAGAGGTSGDGGTASVPVSAAVGGTVFLSASPVHSTGRQESPARGGGGGQPDQSGVAASAAAAPPQRPPPQSFSRHSFGGARLSLSDRANTLTEPKSLLFFPDTPEGHYAQITCGTPPPPQWMHHHIPPPGVH